MTTTIVNHTTSNIFLDVLKENTYAQKVSSFLKDTNTKANALLAYWGAETVIDSILATAFFASGSYFLAFLAFALAAFRSYAILGVLSDIRYL